MQYNRAQLKQSVKQAMKGTRPRPIWITLLYLVIVAAGTWLIGQLLSSLNWSGAFVTYYLNLTLNGVPSDQALEAVLAILFRNGGQMVALIVLGSLVVSFVTYLWQSLMGVGFEGYCLSMVRGRNPGAGQLFCAFPRVGGVLLTRILTGVFIFLWNLLFTAALIVVMVLAGGLATAVPILGVLLMVAGIVAYAVALIWAVLRYALADYILLDQGVSGLAAVRQSKEMMKGNIGRLFVLQLSFIGWYLLIVAVALVGILLMGLTLGALVAASAGMGGIESLGGLYAIMGIFWVVLLLIMVAVLIINVWLQPYLTGSIARFYDFLRGRPVEQQEGWSQPGPGDPWQQAARERESWNQSNYTWTTGQPGQDAGQLKAPGGDSPEGQTEHRDEGGQPDQPEQ